MHHIYHTEGIILDSKNMGEANRYITIYTKELGMVRAMVQGIRHGRSRLRYALADFSYAKIDLVRGRDVWRITSATPIESFAGVFLRDETRACATQMTKLALRLCQGEEGSEALFEHLIFSFRSLSDISLTPLVLKNLELVIVLRILYHLGYIAKTDDMDHLIESPLTEELAHRAGELRRQIVPEINRSLRETQL